MSPEGGSWAGTGTRIGTGPPPERPLRPPPCGLPREPTAPRRVLRLRDRTEILRSGCDARSVPPFARRVALFERRRREVADPGGPPPVGVADLLEDRQSLVPLPPRMLECPPPPTPPVVGLRRRPLAAGVRRLLSPRPGPASLEGTSGGPGPLESAGPDPDRGRYVGKDRHISGSSMSTSLRRTAPGTTRRPPGL